MWTKVRRNVFKPKAEHRNGSSPMNVQGATPEKVIEDAIYHMVSKRKLSSRHI